MRHWNWKRHDDFRLCCFHGNTCLTLRPDNHYIKDSVIQLIWWSATGTGEHPYETLIFKYLFVFITFTNFLTLFVKHVCDATNTHFIDFIANCKIIWLFNNSRHVLKGCLPNRRASPPTDLRCVNLTSMNSQPNFLDAIGAKISNSSLRQGAVW